MSSEIEMVVQLVEKVVKPLLHTQEEMALINVKFNRLKEEWDGLNYKSLELYECWQEQEQSLSQQVSTLEPLVKTLEKSSKTFTALETQLDSAICLGIRKASEKLMEDFRRETFAAVKQEINEASQELSGIAKQAAKGLEAYQSVTLLTHALYIALALAIGILSSTVTFLIYRHQIETLPPCECVLQKVEKGKVEEIMRAKP